jgi:hypothetical protein
MELQGSSRYIDALLLLSLRMKKVNDEEVVGSTSCLSSALLGDLTDHGYIGYAQRSGNYTITEKGRLILSRIKEVPMDPTYMVAPSDYTGTLFGHSV